MTVENTETRASSLVSAPLARELQAAGLVWRPLAGDRFTLQIRGFEGDVFTLSDMVVEAQEHETGTVLGFNGTTEWSLDSAQLTDALWLPREDQARELLGSCFRRLERVRDGFRVDVRLPGEPQETSFDADRPAEAYGRAVLALIRLSTT
jgi:hypothetical protein